MSAPLTDVLSLFVERYQLRPGDESAGRDAIQAAMRGALTIAELREVLSGYNLYPHIAGKVAAALDAAEAAQVEVPASSGDEAPPTGEEPPPQTEIADEEPLAEEPLDEPEEQKSAPRRNKAKGTQPL